jgi:hypothetical protein
VQLAFLRFDHSKVQAMALRFLAMKYTVVVSKNESAVQLWKKHEFEITGTLPKAFRHNRFGLVNVHVMYKLLM